MKKSILLGSLLLAFTTFSYAQQYNEQYTPFGPSINTSIYSNDAVINHRALPTINLSKSLPGIKESTSSYSIQTTTTSNALGAEQKTSSSMQTQQLTTTTNVTTEAKGSPLTGKTPVYAPLPYEVEKKRLEVLLEKQKLVEREDVLKVIKKETSDRQTLSAEKDSETTDEKDNALASLSKLRDAAKKALDQASVSGSAQVKQQAYANYASTDFAYQSYMASNGQASKKVK